MKGNGEEISDAQVNEKFLRSLCPKYEYTVVAIEESRDLNTMSVDELIGSLQIYEERHEKQNKGHVEQVLQAKFSFKEREKKHESSQ